MAGSAKELDAEVLAQHYAVKSALDPDNLFNTRKMLSR